MISAMATPEIMHVYYPPEETEANRVGSVEIIPGDNIRTIHSTFLEKPFGEDSFTKPKLN